MNRWSWFLGVAAVWTVALTGRAQADPAQHCKLELVRLEPLRPGIHVAGADHLYRSVAPQTAFWQSGEDGAWTMVGSTDEETFKEVVKKEPKKYVAKTPLRGVVKLGSKQYGFVLDHKDEKSKLFDRLYFDLKGNGDLADSKPIDAEPPDKLRGPIAVYASIEFPRVDLAIDVDGKKLDYSFFLRLDSYGGGENRYAYASLTSAVYRRGQITLEGKKHEIVLLDNNSHGRFDDRTTVVEDIRGIENQLYPAYGARLLIDAGKAAAARPPSSKSGCEQYLCKINAIDGKFYELQVSPTGDELTCTPSKVAVGKVSSPMAPCTVEVAGPEGYFSLDLEKSQPAAVPAGRWRLVSYTATITGWKEPVGDKAAKKESKAKDKDKDKGGENSLVDALLKAILGSSVESPEPLDGPLYGPQGVCLVSAQGTKAGAPVIVEAGKTTGLKFGPPYKLRVSVIVQPEATPGPVLTETDEKSDVVAKHAPTTARLSLAIVGADGEVVSNLIINGRRPEKPKVTITDPDGKVAAEGNFEYG